MGKILRLGTRLNYPITITQLRKRHGEKISKQQSILEYKWTEQREAGDFVHQDTFVVDQVYYGDWDSPVDGTIKSWKIKVGMVIREDTPFVEVEEDCPHSVQFAGLCGLCGKDMTEIGFATNVADTSRAQISMVHDQTFLKVSQDEASKAEEELQRRLLKHKKLSLVVDLDQTIIQACVEPTIGEWQNDPTSPNHEAVKAVRAFQLEEGPRSMPQGMWYYVKLRPGLEDFLKRIAEMYELHVYTMGTRAYARNIAKLVDPDKSLFGDRIISRDESGSVTSKHLARLFPVDTKMVVIIDDRSDVWPANRSNLIKVVAYDFFTGVGDINASFLPKTQELPKIAPSPKKKAAETPTEKIVEDVEIVETPNGEAEVVKDSSPKVDADAPVEEAKEETKTEPTKPVSALEELVKMGGGDDQALRLEQTAEQEKFLEEQVTARPLLHLQEKLDQEDEIESIEDDGKNGSEHSQHRHSVLRDDDLELFYLQNHLELLHKTFYDEYNAAVLNASGTRVSQLRPGASKKISIEEPAADLKLVPDVAIVMPRLKAKVLQGCVIVTSGIVPLNVDVMRSELGLQIMSFGAKLKKRVTKRITHLVTSSSRARTSKVKEAAQLGNIKIVNQQWLTDSMSKWEKQNEDDYLVEIHEADRKRADGAISDISVQENDDSLLDESSSGTDSEEEAQATQEEGLTDDENLAPNEPEPGSFLESLGNVDWNELNDEMDEYLNDGTESDNESTGSRSSDKDDGRKRRREEQTDDEDSDHGSALSKKQKTSSGRTSALKTPSKLSESSLPTPGVTGDEAGEREGGGDGEETDGGSDYNDLEADLLAELDKDDDEIEDGENENGDTG